MHIVDGFCVYSIFNFGFDSYGRKHTKVAQKSIRYK